MAISPINRRYSLNSGEYRVNIPSSFYGSWTTILDAPGPALQDNANITNPTTQIIFITTHIFETGCLGTTLLLRLGYDDALTLITDPVVRVFGRTGATDPWQLLKNVTGGTEAALVTSANDTITGDLKYTIVDPALQAWDVMGCEQILVGVQTALNGTGDLTNSIIQAKMI